MKYFQFIGNFDPLPLLHQIQRHPELWDQNKLRTTHHMSPHTQVQDIWVRFNDTKPFEVDGNPAHIMDQHESIWYPAAQVLTEVRPLVHLLMGRVQGIRLGRVMITKLAPGKKIDPHVDSGDHAAYYERYHYVLQSLPGSLFRALDEQIHMPAGSCWWFQNAVEHEVINNSADDRIHMIVDVKL